MVGTLLTQFKSALRKKQAAGARGTVCTGKVFHPYLKDCVDQLGMDLKTARPRWKVRTSPQNFPVRHTVRVLE